MCHSIGLGTLKGHNMATSDILFPALVGAVTAIISSLIGAWVTYRTLRKDYQNKYQMELINRQLVACEQLWSSLSVASKSKIKGGEK